MKKRGHVTGRGHFDIPVNHIPVVSHELVQNVCVHRAANQPGTGIKVMAAPHRVNGSGETLGSPRSLHVSQVATSYSTTKDTKNTKGLENETFDAVFQLCHVEVHQQSDLQIR